MKITNYREMPQASREIARFDIELENLGITLHEWRIVRKKAGGWFLSAPNYMIEVEGTKRWLPYVSFNEKRKEEFFTKLNELVAAIMEAEGVKSS